MKEIDRDVVSVETSRSRDGPKMY